MKCRECGKDLGSDDYRMVAKRPFCIPCFDGLLKTAQETPASEPSQAASQQADPKLSSHRCDMCMRPLQADEGKRLLTWLLCSQCHRSLVTVSGAQEPVGGKSEPESLRAGEVAGIDHSEEEKAEDGPGSSAAVRFNSFVHCAGCGRRIPEPGGKILEGAVYCPDCFYAIHKDREEKSVNR